MKFAGRAEHFLAGYFDNRKQKAPATYKVTDELLAVLSADEVPENLRWLARELGAGSAMSSPGLLQRDLVDLWDPDDHLHNLSGPASAALLGGSISSDGEFGAAGVTFSVSGGIVGFVTFAIPAALLVPGGGFYVAYRLYRMFKDTGTLRQYARVSRAAPHVAVAVAASDDKITRDEARLLRDLLRGRLGSPQERYGLLKLELATEEKQEAAFAALAGMELEPQDWRALLAIALATAHADDDYSGDERNLIDRLQRLTDFSPEEFAWLASEAEEDYRLRCHIGEATVRACYQIATAGESELPEDAKLLMEAVLCAAVPSDTARRDLVQKLLDGQAPAMTRFELTRGASVEKPSIFKRLAGAKSELAEREADFGETIALFCATLEQWRGWVVPACREELIAIGEQYEQPAKRLLRKLREAHDNIESLRHDWIAPRPWSTRELATQVEVRTVTPRRGAFGVTGIAGGLFLFHRGDQKWEWRSASTPFDDFRRDELPGDSNVHVETDDATWEMLEVMLQAYQSETAVKRTTGDEE